MSEQDRKRAGGMPQRWKLEKGPDGAWNTAQMTTTEDGEWCKANDVAAALAQARREVLDLLREYGDHAPECSGGYPPYKCKCGWEEVYSRLLAKEKVNGK